MTFAYPTGPDPIRPDLVEQYRRVWHHIASPGTWLSGVERVAIADETRRARVCALCRERKAALSPFSVEGEHDHGGRLRMPLVDVVHRVTTDAARLTRKWFEGVLAEGVSADEYVETLGVAVQVISIDAFHDALGLDREPLPEPVAGEPTRKRPRAAAPMADAWVPGLSGSDLEPEYANLYEKMPRAPAVIRALSLVPAEVLSWKELAAAQYLATEAMMGMKTGRALDRAQIELVAGRVSALNECFY